MHKVILAALAIVAGQACAQQAETLAKVTASNAMLAEPKLDARAMHECQPLKGDIVAILEVRKNLDGMMGLNIARVRVVDGLCTGKTGWIGVERLETTR